MKPTAPHNDRTAPRHESCAAKRTKKSRASGPRVPAASREAKRIAASVLEVLAGDSSPTAAAAALQVSLPRYYLLEQRAIEALVTACEPRSGRTIAPKREIDLLRKQLDRAQRDSTRYQTLLRVAQRTMGLVPAATPTHGKGKGSAKAKRTRRPTARALVAARSLLAGDDLPADPAAQPAGDDADSIIPQPPGGPTIDQS